MAGFPFLLNKAFFTTQFLKCFIFGSKHFIHFYVYLFNTPEIYSCHWCEKEPNITGFQTIVSFPKACLDPSFQLWFEMLPLSNKKFPHECESVSGLPALIAKVFWGLFENTLSIHKYFLFQMKFHISFSSFNTPLRFWLKLD